MGTFSYKAIGGKGAVTEGTLEAANRTEALRKLEALHLQPIRVTEKGGGSPAPAAAAASGTAGKPFSLRLGHEKIKFSQLENFTRQLSSLLAAGVPLARALQILGRESSSPAASAKWKEIHDMVIDGTALADAMARSPEVFPRVYVAMVQAGEMGGFLDVVLGQIAEFQIREKDLRAKITSALIYPAVLLMLAIGVLVFLLTFFIPRFKTIFSGFGAALPLLTRIIVGASEVATHYGIFVALVIGVCIYFFRRWLQSEAGKRAWQRTILRLPVIGPLASRFAMARFCRMLGTLVGSGVPLIQALRVARESIGNQALTDAVTNSIERVKKGDSLAASLGDCPALFPVSVIEMISVSEETGRMDQELVRLATVTEGELDQRLRTAVALAEPMMLFLMAGFIGVIFIGMVIPIFSIQDYIK
jgi:type II secretory pathway component PulF